MPCDVSGSTSLVVEAELLSIRLPLLYADVLPGEHDVDCITGCDVDQREDDDGYADENQHGLAEPSEDEGKHGAPTVGPRCAGSRCQMATIRVKPGSRRQR